MYLIFQASIQMCFHVDRCSVSYLKELMGFSENDRPPSPPAWRLSCPQNPGSHLPPPFRTWVSKLLAWCQGSFLWPLWLWVSVRLPGSGPSSSLSALQGVPQLACRKWHHLSGSRHLLGECGPWCSLVSALPLGYRVWWRRVAPPWSQREVHVVLGAASSPASAWLTGTE